MRALAVTCAIVLAATPVAAHDPADAQPVMYGLDGPDMDGCGGWGRVNQLNPAGDNFLAVRAAPTTRASKLDELSSGQEIWFCDSSEDQDWQGIVYRGEGQENFDCATGPNLDHPVPYPGPCRSGWVHGDYVTLLAG